MKKLDYLFEAMKKINTRSVSRVPVKLDPNPLFM